jgi:glycosyltransferase involved in cell wall biosynthesis
LPNQIFQKNYLYTPFKKLFSYLSRFILKYVGTRLDAIVTATPKIADEFKSYKCKLVNDVRNFPIIEPISLLPKKFDFCYAGGLSKIRISTTIDAISQTNYSIIIAGDFDNMDFEKIIKGTKGWINNVIFKGYLNKEDVRNICLSSKVGCTILLDAPNHVDGITTKFFEYLEAGIPVISTSNNSLSKKIIDKYKCGIYVDPNDINEIVKTFDYMMSHEDEVKQMGLNGRIAIEAEYNWKFEEKKLLHLYSEVISR